MPTSTYEKIATYTVPSAQASYTFTSIPSTYTDLVLISAANVATGNPNMLIRVGNGSVDTGSNYSNTFLYGTGSVAGSSRTTSQTSAYIGAASSSSEFAPTIVHLQNYANTTTYKTFLSRFGWTGVAVYSTVALWRSTAPINTITLSTDGANFATGSTFTLYGIKAA